MPGRSSHYSIAPRSPSRSPGGAVIAALDEHSGWYLIWGQVRATLESGTSSAYFAPSVDGAGAAARAVLFAFLTGQP